uniref:Uncharacterized protein n=1 Tax=Ciona intestinalis TaxID=7719 RepID=H2XTP2_CIOIN
TIKIVQATTGCLLLSGIDLLLINPGNGRGFPFSALKNV